MFKDIYKSANDSIDTTGVYARITANLNKKKKSYVPYYSYAAAAACAAAVLIFVFVPYFNKSGNTPTTLMSTDNIAVTATVQPKITDTEIPEAKQSDTALADMPEIPETTPVIQPETKPESPQVHSNTAFDVSQPDPILEASEPPKPEEPKPYIMMSINAAPAMRYSRSAVTNEANVSGGGGGGASGGGSSANTNDKSADIPESGIAMASILPEPQAVTYGEYSDYIGYDVASLNFDGYTYASTEFDGVYRDENGEFTQDMFTFCFSNGTKQISINTTKNTSAVELFLNNTELEKSDLNGTPAVIMQNDEKYSVYFMKNDTAFTVDTYEIDETELENILRIFL